MFAVVMFVNVGMWFERFVIVVTSLHRDFLASSWDMYVPTLVDILTFVGSFGLFFTMFLLFIRFAPIVAIAEVKSVMPTAHPPHEETKPLGDYWGDAPDIGAYCRIESKQDDSS
jgi:molybdopterin-containing oxidoreductase family membrane subunit